MFALCLEQPLTLAALHMKEAVLLFPLPGPAK